MNLEMTAEELESEGITAENWYPVFLAIGDMFFEAFGELPETIYTPRAFYDALELKTKLKTLDMPANAWLVMKHPRGPLKIMAMPGTSAIVTPPIWSP